MEAFREGPGGGVGGQDFRAGPRVGEGLQGWTRVWGKCFRARVGRWRMISGTAWGGGGCQGKSFRVVWGEGF